MSVRKITAIVLIVTIIGLIAYDIYALVVGGVDSTISKIVLDYSKQTPALAFGMGYVAGHLTWPQKKD